jgi:hypothetical protein
MEKQREWEEKKWEGRARRKHIGETRGRQN